MKRLYTISLVVIALFCTANAKAQTGHWGDKVIGSSGGYGESANYTMCYTVGEAYIVTATSSGYHVTQGFHQPDIAVLSVEEFQQIDISVYPNPADEYINVSSSESTKMSVYDMQGKLVRTLDIFESLTTIDVSDLERGTYTLVFEANGELANRMKIVIM